MIPVPKSAIHHKFDICLPGKGQVLSWESKRLLDTIYQLILHLREILGIISIESITHEKTPFDIFA